MAKCYNCGTSETIHELDNLCEPCLAKLSAVDGEPRKPIWLTDFEQEVLGGYLAEMLDETENGELVDYAREVFSSVLNQIEEINEQN